MNEEIHIIMTVDSHILAIEERLLLTEHKVLKSLWLYKLKSITPNPVQQDRE